MTKKILALVLALALCLTLFAGCGSKTDEPVVENNEPVAEPVENKIIYGSTTELGGDFLYTHKLVFHKNLLSSFLWLLLKNLIRA